MNARLVIAAVLGLSALATSAEAATGVLKGKLEYYRVNGNYCDSGRNCTGAYYPEVQYQTWAPIANAKVYLNITSATNIGSGTTDANGNFTIQWNSALGVNGATIRFRTEHKDDRFWLENSSAVKWLYVDSPINLVAGTTTASPQVLPDPVHFETESSPSMNLNLYGATYLTYQKAVSTSLALFETFVNIRIRGVFEADDCGTCAPGNTVRINETFAFDVGGVAHELGHVVSLLMNPRDRQQDYCYDPVAETFCTYPDSFCCLDEEDETFLTHDFDTEEWHGTQFDEGFATAFAAFALYDKTNPDPYVCPGQASDSCPSTSNNKYRLEPSTGRASQSAACNVQRRWELSAARFIWDVYDNTSETYAPPAGLGSDTVTKSAYAIYDVIALYPAGRGYNQDEEQLSSSGPTAWDNRDGFGPVSYYWMALEDPPGSAGPMGSIATQYSNNCLAPSYGTYE